MQERLVNLCSIVGTRPGVSCRVSRCHREGFASKARAKEQTRTLSIRGWLIGSCVRCRVVCRDVRDCARSQVCSALLTIVRLTRSVRLPWRTRALTTLSSLLKNLPRVASGWSRGVQSPTRKVRTLGAFGTICQGGGTRRNAPLLDSYAHQFVGHCRAGCDASRSRGTTSQTGHCMFAEFFKICGRVGLGFAVLGFVGFFVKMIFIVRSLRCPRDLVPNIEQAGNTGGRVKLRM